MSTFATDLPTDEQKTQADRLFSGKMLTTFTLPVLVVIYLAFVFLVFDIAGLAVHTGKMLISDRYGYGTRVERDNRNGDILGVACRSVSGKPRVTFAGMTGMLSCPQMHRLRYAQPDAASVRRSKTGGSIGDF
ncbi:hypothetical protein HW561_14765 [Rhodobacteraceae bacterium B1Z28]|uniref:Uncharacterized protein n=1 Tax=Ruegeria haliotis TaxID=2747601 RepID=A0ABX2PSA6_9RHOB|nr:hypothetical protein [Ruegeria haliotis]NVO57053.1 hypothetical protein [Ruegeria haliotis]